MWQGERNIDKMIQRNPENQGKKTRTRQYKEKKQSQDTKTLRKSRYKDIEVWQRYINLTK